MCDNQYEMAAAKQFIAGQIAQLKQQISDLQKQLYAKEIERIELEQSFQKTVYTGDYYYVDEEKPCVLLLGVTTCVNCGNSFSSGTTCNMRIDYCSNCTQICDYQSFNYR